MKNCVYCGKEMPKNSGLLEQVIHYDECPKYEEPDTKITKKTLEETMDKLKENAAKNDKL